MSKDFGCSKITRSPADIALCAICMHTYVPFVPCWSFIGICSTTKIAALPLLGSILNLFPLSIATAEVPSTQSELHTQVLHRQLAQSKCLIDRLCVVLHHFDGKGLHKCAEVLYRH